MGEDMSARQDPTRVARRWLEIAPAIALEQHVLRVGRTARTRRVALRRRWIAEEGIDNTPGGLDARLMLEANALAGKGKRGRIRGSAAGDAVAHVIEEHFTDPRASRNGEDGHPDPARGARGMQRREQHLRGNIAAGAE